MDSDKQKRKIILLVIIGVAIAVLAFIYAYSQLFGSSDLPTNNEQYATFPDSGIREIPNEATVDDVSQVPTSPVPTLDTAPVQLENNSFQSETDWRDEIVYPEPTVAKPDTVQPVTEGTSQNTNELIEALSAAAEKFSSYKPVFPDREAMLYVPLLDQSNLTDCGIIDVPSSVSAQERLISNVEKNDSVICMGEAIANDCSVAKATIVDSGVSEIYIVAERTDGICGIGLTFIDTVVNLCNVTNVMNAMTGEENNFTEWKNTFADRPGETFSQLFLGDIERLSKAIVENKLDCKKFEL